MARRRLTPEQEQKIRMLRATEGLTTETLAERFGVSASAIRETISGRRDTRKSAKYREAAP